MTPDSRDLQPLADEATSLLKGPRASGAPDDLLPIARL